MRVFLFLVFLLGVWVEQAAAQQPRPPRDIDLFSPRQNFPLPQQQPVQQRPGGIESAPLPPPPGSAVPPTGREQPDGVPEIALPPLEGPRRDPPAQADRPPADSPGEETVPQQAEVKISNPTAVFSGLDKITGRIFPFEVSIDETVQFGALQVTPRTCYTRPPTEPQNTTGFIEVDEITLDGNIKRLFTGWMFAASPGLHAVEHAIYDVWLVDCKDGPPEVAERKD